MIHLSRLQLLIIFINVQYRTQMLAQIYFHKREMYENLARARDYITLHYLYKSHSL